MNVKQKLLMGPLLGALVTTSAWADERGGYDAFLVNRGAKQLAVSADTLSTRGVRVEHEEARVGVPTFLWSTSSTPPSLSAQLRGRPEDAAREYLRQHADVYRLHGADVSSAVSRGVHDTGKGPVIARFGQSIDGVEVFRNEVKVVMNRELGLVAISGYLAPSQAMQKARATPGSSAFRLSAAEAIQLALHDTTGLAIAASSLEPLGAKGGDYERFELEPGARNLLTWQLAAPVRAKKVFFPLGEQLVPGWYVEVNAGPRDSQETAYFSYVVSATDGALLLRHDLTADASYTYRLWADPTTRLPHDGPQGTEASPHPTGQPDHYQPPFIAPNLVTLENYPFSRNDPWLPPNATQTVGNNVDAYVDLVAPDGFQPQTDLRATVTSPGTFDYLYDTGFAPNATVTQRLAATTSLFYLNNFLHDWYYDFGFDEQAGNAQALNYGRGGVEQDPLRAEAQDHSGRNNANMSTPADGAQPRMQMYIFDGEPTLEVTAPVALAGRAETNTAAFGPQTFDVTGNVRILDPAGATLGCEAFPPDAFAGRIALIDRGTCSFVIKVANAQAAGAVAVIVANNEPNALIGEMVGAEPIVTIPTLSTTQAAANAWKAAVRTNDSTVTVRMRRSSDLDRDGTLDNDIVAHEWGHYISNRLIANANGLTNNQGRSLGEGWADFHALLLQVREADRTRPGNELYQGVYASAAYTQSGGANNGAYFGIRRVPYSTDFSKNALTFKHIANGVPLPATHPVAFGATGAINSEVHNSGEVWASMLWECYASLLNAYPFQEAQDRMKTYLVAAYKVTPASPTLLEARDALWAVAAATDPSDHARFVQAFAKRGAGLGAKGPDRDSADHVGVVESFATGNNLEVVAIRLDDTAGACDKDGVLDLGEQGVLSVTVRNTGAGALTHLTGTVTQSGATASFHFVDAQLTFPEIAPGASTTAKLRLNLESVTPAGAAPPRAGLTITFDELSLPPSARTVTYDEYVHFDEALGNSASDDLEGSVTAWQSTLLNRGEPAWARTGDASNHFVHAPDFPFVSELVFTSPWLQVNPTGDFTFSFKYRHSFETGADGVAYDGAVIELTDDGLTWYDLFRDLGINPGYSLYLAQGDNPLSERAAFANQSAGFPSWVTRTVNLRTMVAGSSVRVRVRVGTDSGVGAYGMDLDDFVFNNVANTPFGRLVVEPSNGTVCNVRPVASAGLPQAVPEGTASADGTLTRTTVHLDGTRSFDPEGSPLTYHWTQVGGPPVILSATDVSMPSFIPDVAASTTLAFQLVVHDGTESSLPSQVTITVTNVNRPPRAVASAPGTVPERSAPDVSLDGTASTDADGEPLTFLWKQVSGPTVALDNPASATPRFALPEVPADTQLTFALVVNDGTSDSNTATVAITVLNVDRAPTANAGQDQTVAGRISVALAGAGSDADGEALAYAWTQLSGPTVTLAGANTTSPSFTSPDVKAATELVFQLAVTAGGATASDTVTVLVQGDGAPVANAGEDAEVAARSTVRLSGAASDPESDALIYAWRQLSGPEVTLAGANTASPTFDAPDVRTAEPAVLVFELTATANGLSTTDTVAITVRRSNRPPVARGPSDMVENERTSVTLSAQGSSDPDGDALTYQWEQTAGPVVKLTGADTAELSFITPEVLASTVLTFRLVVKDTDGVGNETTVRLTVRDVNRAPTSRPSVAAGGISGQRVTLDGSGSTDPDGDALSYQWKQVEGPTVALSATDKSVTVFDAPVATATDLQLVFELSVVDARGLSNSDTVAVTVRRTNRHPVAHGPNDMVENERTFVTLSAKGSSDPDGDALTYQWEQSGGPVVTVTGADTAELSFTTPEVLADTVLTFRLVVKDASGASSEATVRLTVKDANRAPTSRPSVAAGGASGQRVTLDGTASTDPDGDTLRYQWKQVEGPTVALSATDKSVTVFDAPVASTSDIQLVFELTVADASGLTSTERVSVTITKETKSGTGCSSTSGASGLAPLALVALSFVASRRRRSHQLQ